MKKMKRNHFFSFLTSGCLLQHFESLAQHDRSLLLGQPVHRSTHQVATTQKNYEIFENVLQSKGVIDVMQNFIGPESDHWLPLSLTP